MYTGLDFQRLYRGLRRNRGGRLALTAACVLGMLSMGAHAASPCPISLMTGSAVNTIDGIRDAEWTDALGIEGIPLGSGSVCLRGLLDSDGVTYRDITVYSKTVNTGVEDALAFFFEIEDESGDGTPAGDEFSVSSPDGERVILQIDVDFSGGSEIAGDDFKFDFRHIWRTPVGALDPDEIELFASAYDGSGPDTVCMHATWTEVAPETNVSPGTVAALAGVQFAARRAPGGYNVEVLIPFSAIGAAAVADMGVAFGVVNDWADCTVAGLCDDHGSSFPFSLPMDTTDSPVPGGLQCNSSWAVPDDWATGYVTTPPEDVFFSHVPEYWISEDVDALACDVLNNNYYPDTPCRMQIQARPNNTSGAAQTRNILYVVAAHGISPATWHYVDLQENVLVEPGAPLFRTSDFADDMDVTNLTGHPCVRAYLLPPAISPAFNRAAMEAITSQTDLDTMVATYGLESQHSAQQNISRQAETSDCPDTTCFATVMAPRIQPEVLLASNSNATGGRLDLRSFGAAGAFGGTLAGATTAVIRDDNFDDRDDDGRGGFIPPVLEDLGDMAEFAQTDVILTVTGFAANAIPASPPRYNLVEEIGGVVEMIPITIIGQNGGAIAAFDVSNTSDVARWIWLAPQMHTPPQLAGLRLDLDTSRVLYGPGETRRVTTRFLPAGGGFRVASFSGSAHIGINEPTGSFGSSHDGRLSLGFDLVYHLRPQVGIEGYLGYEDFSGNGGFSDEDATLVTVSARRWFTSGRLRPFVGAGAGYYWFDKDDGFGASLQVGLTGNLSTRLMWEVTFRRHFVDVTDRDFWSAQVGLRRTF